MSTANFYAVGHGGGPSLRDKDGHHDRLHVVPALANVTNWPGYQIQNPTEALGDFASVEHDKSLAGNWALLEVVEQKAAPVSVTLGGVSIESYGSIKARFIPPLDDALHQLERYFAQSVRLMDALADVRRKQNNVFTGLLTMLNELAKHTSPQVSDSRDGGKVPTNAEMRSFIEAAAMEVQDALDFEHTGHSALSDSLSLWRECRKILAAEQAADVAAGKIGPLNWRDALVRAQKSTGVTRPTPDI